MCSRMRGPARAPSLVTWPIITTATPCCLASRVSCAAQSRTCDTLPGADCRSSLIIVWMESMTTTAGLTCSMAWVMWASDTSASIGSVEPSMPRRAPRKATCASDSSPLTYSTRWLCDISASACSSSVDLPMPGSPPISTTEPGTMPPPSTRSNSANPVGSRGTVSTGTSDSRAIDEVSASMPAAGRRPPASFFGSRNSSSVFQAWQAGHCPSHLAVVLPHSRQTNWVLAVAMFRPPDGAHGAPPHTSAHSLACRRTRPPRRSRPHRPTAPPGCRALR